MGSVLGQICEKMEYGKRVEKGVGKGDAENEVCGGLRQRRGSAEGEEASPRCFASMCFAYCSARPATSERGAADLQAAASAADLL